MVRLLLLNLCRGRPACGVERASSACAPARRRRRAIAATHILIAAAAGPNRLNDRQAALTCDRLGRERFSCTLSALRRAGGLPWFSDVLNPWHYTTSTQQRRVDIYQCSSTYCAYFTTNYILSAVQGIRTLLSHDCLFRALWRSAVRLQNGVARCDHPQPNIHPNTATPHSLAMRQRAQSLRCPERARRRFRTSGTTNSNNATTASHRISAPPVVTTAPPGA